MSCIKKSAVIFGGLGGIGKSISQELVRNGLEKLAIIDILNETEVSNQNILSSEEPNAPVKDFLYIYKVCSVSDKQRLKQVMTFVKQEFGGLDFIINAAGIANELDYEKLIETGTVNTTLIGIELMRKDKGNFGGTIINIASVAGLRPIFFLPIYSGTKYAILGFTRSLTNEEFHKVTGINFITICPGATRTPIIGHAHVVDKFLFPEMLKQVKTISKEMKVQEPEIVSKCVMIAIDDNKNGSIWQCENGRIEKAVMHNYPAF